MNQKKFLNFVKEIVEKSNNLKNKYTDETDAYVNYACIFPQTDKEYDKYFKLASNLGKIVMETKTGPLFQIQPLKTVSGLLQVLKVRKPDPTRTELGDADFTVSDYPKFKETYLDKEEFKLIERPNMEMIELREDSCDVLVYFSFPPMDEQLGIK